MSKLFTATIAKLEDWVFALSHRFKAMTRSVAVREPFETMLYPTTMRLRGFGILIIIDHVVSYVVLMSANAHTYESI